MKRFYGLPALAVVVNFVVGCGSAPDCPTGTTKAGTRCQPVDDRGVDSVGKGEVDAAVVVDAAAVEPPLMPVPDAAISTSDAAGETPCYLDHDHDQVGAGEPVDCDDPLIDDTGLSVNDASAARGDAAVESVLPVLVKTTGDCDDFHAQRAPGLPELCDGVDNDCDDSTDEDSKNACGGACTRLFEHQPGEACNNQLSGSCARTGSYECLGDDEVVCNVPQVNPSNELCADAIDNDCDGLVDEPDAHNAVAWYQDCDGDGYAASTTGAVKSCVKPAKLGSCSWTSVVPQANTRSNWDCNDASSAYSPKAVYGLPPSGFTSYDLNCDGQNTADPAFKTGYHVCSSSIISKLNAGESACIAEADEPLKWTKCVMWKDANGKYTSTSPVTKCPDARAYRVAITLQVPQWHLWNCQVSALPAAWPCR